MLLDLGQILWTCLLEKLHWYSNTNQNKYGCYLSNRWLLDFEHAVLSHWNDG